MKYSSAFVLAALLGASYVEQSSAVKIGAGYTDDLMKSLAEDMQKDTEQADAAEAAEPAPKEQKKEEPKKTEKKSDKKSEKKDKKKDAKKKDAKKDKKAEKKPEKKKEEDQEIPMDAAAIKAYSSVIADAAEDSEPQNPVQYHQVMAVEDEQKAPKAEPFQVDPMGSMIQNEISAIKDASIAAAKDKMDE